MVISALSCEQPTNQKIYSLGFTRTWNLVGLTPSWLPLGGADLMSHPVGWRAWRQSLLSGVTGAAPERRLEVMNGFLKNLSLPALAGVEL